MALPTRRDYMSSMAPADCGICLQPLTQSTSTTCRHYFCRGCIRDWLRSNNTCPTCRAELFNDGAPRPRAQEQAREEQSRTELNERAPGVDSQDEQVQTPGEILEMLRAIGLEGEELEMQEHLWNEARRPSTPSNDRQRAVASLATRQILGLSQSVSERSGTQPGIALQEADQRRQVQLMGEPAATMSNLHSTGMASYTLGEPVEEQSNQQPSVAGGQTTTSDDQSGQRVEPNSLLTHDEISALYTQLGMSRSQIFVCNSAAMDRLMHRLQPEQDAQPEWYAEIKDRDVLYTFKLGDTMFEFYWISYEIPSWYARLPSGREQSELLNSLSNHHRKWTRQLRNLLYHVRNYLFDEEVRRLMQEESANPLEERARTA